MRPFRHIDNGGSSIKRKLMLSLIALVILCVQISISENVQPDSAATWNAKGTSLYSQSKYDEAQQAFNKAIELDPKSPPIWYNKGNALYSQGKYDEAIKAYDKVIELDPKYAYVWFAKGKAFYYQRKHDEAIQCFDKALVSNPQNADAWNLKGSALNALGRSTEANEAFAEARELRPKAEVQTPPSDTHLFLSEPVQNTQNNVAHVPATSTEQEFPVLVDHAMASKVDKTTNSVITRTNVFSSADSRAYSWLSLGTVEASTVEWKWYSPNGNLYHTGVHTIPKPNGAYWSVYNAWYYIDIAGTNAAKMSGNWHVDFYMNEKKILTEPFIMGGTVSEGAESSTSNKDSNPSNEKISQYFSISNEELLKAIQGW